MENLLILKQSSPRSKLFKKPINNEINFIDSEIASNNSVSLWDTYNNGPSSQGVFATGMSFWLSSYFQSNMRQQSIQRQ